MAFKFGFGKSSVDKGTLSSRLAVERSKSDIILNAIENGVVVIDDQKIIQLFNPAAATLSGWPASEAIGLDFHSVFKLVDEKNTPYDDQHNPFMIALQTGKNARDNHALLTPRSGSAIAVNIDVSPLQDEDGNLSGAVGMVTNVNSERSEEKQRADFISTASHEMRTPVAAIEGYLALAMNDKVSKIDAKARDYLEKAHSSTQHLGQLFQDLLTSAKAEDGRLSSHPTSVNMSAFLQQLSEDLRFGAEKKGLVVEYVVGNSGAAINGGENAPKVIEPLYFVLVDPDRLREVITNLFDNAVKYTDSGKISIGLTGNDQVVQFFIKDTGPGIPAPDVPHLFQKFYRVDNSSTRTTGGTGLGLFICRKIVELYKGRIWVESEEGKGSTFYINLPRITPEKAAEIQRQAASQSLPEIQAPSTL
ncbi:MAG TPA: ATP-binding protein [Candidatus Saccharimonadales bacterium]|nr:ATP-binding protein [Candidatus Saccharimonadales bacterium]